MKICADAMRDLVKAGKAVDASYFSEEALQEIRPGRIIGNDPGYNSFLDYALMIETETGLYVIIGHDAVARFLIPG